MMENFDYVCLECGNVQTFPFNDYKKKQIGNIEEIFCFECQNTTKHMNVGDLNTFIEWNDSKEADLIREVIEKRKSHGR